MLVSIPDRDFSGFQGKEAPRSEVVAKPFQSLIGILVDFKGNNFISL